MALDHHWKTSFSSLWEGRVPRGGRQNGSAGKGKHGGKILTPRKWQTAHLGVNVTHMGTGQEQWLCGQLGSRRPVWCWGSKYDRMWLRRSQSKPDSLGREEQAQGLELQAPIRPCEGARTLAPWKPRPWEVNAPLPAGPQEPEVKPESPLPSKSQAGPPLGCSGGADAVSREASFGKM